MDAMDLFDRSPKIRKKDWMDRKSFILGTVDNLASIIDHCISSGRYACDLETSGIDTRVFEMPSGLQSTRDQIAGVCLSPDGETGYYIPLRHATVSSVDGSRTPYKCNIAIDVFANEFKRLAHATEAGKTVAIFHNGKFDHEFLQFNGTGEPWGEWEKPSIWDDTMILCYLRNSRARNKKLKDLSGQPPPSEMPRELWANAQCGGPGLGMEMIELHELFGHETEKSGFRYDFTTLDPTSQEVLWYAASDVICTWLLYPLLSPPVLTEDTDGNSQRNIYIIEKSVITAERWMERCQIHVDIGKVSELIILGHTEWWDAVVDVYRNASEILGRDIMPGKFKVLQENIVLDDPSVLLNDQLEVSEKHAKPMYGDKPSMIIGRDNRRFPETYDIMSPLQLGTMFDEMNVPNLKYTEKSKQVMTSREELDRVVEEAGSQFPFMNKVKRFREVNKALSNYLYPLISDIELTGGIDPNGGLMRIAFNGRKVDTGRYATSGSGDRAVGFPKINFQAIPSTAFDPDHPRPECMRRIREVVTARPTPDGHPHKYMVAVDFSGEELRLITNMSGETKWVTEFFRCSECSRTFSRDPRSETVSTPLPPPPRCPNCGSDKIGDLHTLTAIEVYGQDAPNRPEWKVLRGNAKGVNFGLCYGGGPRAVQLATGCDKNEGYRIKSQYDKTYSGLRAWWDTMHRFARKHSFVRTAFGRKYPLPDINHMDGFFKSKAERNAVNGPIQGTGADIIKIVMSLIFKEMKKRGWLTKVMMIATMHDELVFEIDADILEEAIQVIVQIMTANNIILGRNWIIPLTCDVEIGNDWSVPWDVNGMTYKEVRFLGSKKIKGAKKCPEGVDYESLPSWPTELAPWFRASNHGMRPVLLTTPATPPVAPTPPPMAAVQSVASTQKPADTDGMTINQIPSSMAVANIAHLGMPSQNESPVWEFRLRAPLTPDTIVKLANLIVTERGRGMTVLKIRTADGSLLNMDASLERVGCKTPVMVSKLDFEAGARLKGLV